MLTFTGEACGNTFFTAIDLEGSGSHCESFIRSMPRSKWTFDTALLLARSKSGNMFMRVMERDGSISAMCGNGARFAALVFSELGVPPILDTGQSTVYIDRVASDHFALPISDIQGGSRQCFEKERGILGQWLFWIGGEPHCVVKVNCVNQAPLVKWGKLVTPWANCTVFQKVGRRSLRACTYERGVNRITASCGTGACAASMAFWTQEQCFYPVTVAMHGHEMRVHGDASGVVLEGPARIY